MCCFFAVFLVGLEEVDDDEVEEAGVASAGVGANRGGAICGSVTVGAVGVIAKGKGACWVGGGPNIGTTVLKPVWLGLRNDWLLNGGAKFWKGSINGCCCGVSGTPVAGLWPVAGDVPTGPT